MQEFLNCLPQSIGVYDILWFPVKYDLYVKFWNVALPSTLIPPCLFAVIYNYNLFSSLIGLYTDIKVDQLITHTIISMIKF